MNNRKAVIAGLVVVLFLVLGAVNCAYADFTNIFTVGSNGSEVKQSVFTLNQTPWLYLELPSTGFNVAASVWSDPSSNPFTVTEVGGNTKYWLSLNSGLDESNNPVTWNSVKQVGTWNITAGYLYPFSTKDYAGAGETSFKVTAVPEPVSTVLFLLGGATLAVRRFRRK